MLTQPIIGSGVSQIASTLNLNLKGSVSAVDLAKNRFNVLREIARLKPPIHIYVFKELTDEIKLILEEMGLKVKILPVEKLEPPYIYIEEVGSNIIVLTENEKGKIVTVVVAKLKGFLNTFIGLFIEHYPEKAKKMVEMKIIEYEETSKGNQRELLGDPWKLAPALLECWSTLIVINSSISTMVAITQSGKISIRIKPKNIVKGVRL